VLIAFREVANANSHIMRFSQNSSAIRDVQRVIVLARSTKIRNCSRESRSIRYAPTSLRANDESSCCAGRSEETVCLFSRQQGFQFDAHRCVRAADQIAILGNAPFSPNI
jgi:hypothetical protein